MNHYISITKASGSKNNSFLIDQIKSLHTCYETYGDYVKFNRNSNGNWDLECRGEINIKTFTDAIDSIQEQIYEGDTLNIFTKIIRIDPYEELNESNTLADMAWDYKWVGGRRVYEGDC